MDTEPRNRAARTPDTTTRTCIYCTETKAVSSFNREHVIGRAWGTFSQSSALASTTLDCVCKPCNQHFGDKFENRAARGSFEGLSRYHEGLRNDVDDILYDRVVLTLDRPFEHAGILIRMLPGRPMGLPMAGLLPQLCFRTANQSRWTSIPVVALERAADPTKLLPPFAVDSGTICRALADNEADETRANAMLLRLMPKFRESTDATPSLRFGTEVIVTTAARFDNNIRRTMAKFAFNMLAAHVGASFVLASDFDPIREFIRWGRGEGHKLVRPVRRPILGDETPNFRRHAGHFVVVEWVRRNSGIQGRVSLFNEATYAVDLAHSYSGLYRFDLSHGVHFDPDTGTAEALTQSNFIVAPWA